MRGISILMLARLRYFCKPYTGSLEDVPGFPSILGVSLFSTSTFSNWALIFLSSSQPLPFPILLFCKVVFFGNSSVSFSVHFSLSQAPTRLRRTPQRMLGNVHNCPLQEMIRHLSHNRILGTPLGFLYLDAIT